jgi:protein involved in polysaccharide export with SLBB domain
MNASPKTRRQMILAMLGLTSVLLFAPPLHSQTQPYRVGPGDIIHVMIYAGGDKQEDFTAEISPTGTMSSPLIGAVEVRGLTPSAVAERMTEILARDFFVNPQVLVSVKEYGRKIYVMGEVRRPGAFNIQEGLTALNACILAGGFTEYAWPGRAKVSRMENGKQKVLEIDLGKVQEGKAEDLVLHTGDRIYIPQRWF